MTQPTESTSSGLSAQTPDASPAAPPPEKAAGEGTNRQEALVALGRRALASPDPATLMRDAAALLAEIFGAPLCGAAWVSPDGRCLHFQLASADSEQSTEKPKCFEYSTQGEQSLAGYALHVARPVTTDDLAHEQRFGDAVLRQQGVRSAVAVPLKMPGRSFGALLACSPEVRAFHSEHMPFAEAVAHLVATTLARVDAESALARERRFATSVIDTVDALVLLLDKRGHVVRMNRTCEQVTDFSLLEIQNRPVWSVLAAPNEQELFQDAVRRVVRGQSVVRFESLLLTKHSAERHVTWSASGVPDGSGGLTILLAGLDITTQRQAEEAARRAEQVAQKTRQAMARVLLGKPAKELNEEQQPDEMPFVPREVPAGGERRRHPRRAYPYVQRIAPITGDELPPLDSFYEVQCHDIAAGGFSFYADSPLAADSLVVALGTPPRLTYLVAQVAHVTRVERDGKKVFLIGCNYTDRVDY